MSPVMLRTLLAQIEHALVAAEAWTHARLELRVIVLAAVSLVVAHANPRLLYIVVKL